MNLIVAETILEQMNGKRVLVMFTGASNFAGDETSVGFRFKGSKVANHIKVALNGCDLYDITFTKIHGFNFRTVKEINNVYAEDLVNIFESTTGLYLSF